MQCAWKNKLVRGALEPAGSQLPRWHWRFLPRLGGGRFLSCLRPYDLIGSRVKVLEPCIAALADVATSTPITIHVLRTVKSERTSVAVHGPGRLCSWRLGTPDQLHRCSPLARQRMAYLQLAWGSRPPSAASPRRPALRGTQDKLLFYSTDRGVFDRASISGRWAELSSLASRLWGLRFDSLLCTPLTGQEGHGIWPNV